jgi:hypothetical protein
VLELAASRERAWTPLRGGYCLLDLRKLRATARKLGFFALRGGNVHWFVSITRYDTYSMLISNLSLLPRERATPKPAVSCEFASEQRTARPILLCTRLIIAMCSIMARNKIIINSVSARQTAKQTDFGHWSSNIIGPFWKSLISS